jgi:enoyl-CoA hydratase
MKSLVNGVSHGSRESVYRAALNSHTNAVEPAALRKGIPAAKALEQLAAVISIHWHLISGNPASEGEIRPTNLHHIANMLSARLRPCAAQFGKFMVPLRVRYSTAVEQSFEHIKVSTPRPGVGLGTPILYGRQRSQTKSSI